MDLLSTLTTTKPKALYTFNSTSASLDRSGNGTASITPTGTPGALNLIPSISGTLRWTSSRSLSTTLVPNPIATYIIGLSSDSERDVLSLGSAVTVTCGPTSSIVDVTFSDASGGSAEVSNGTNGSVLLLVAVSDDGVEIRNINGSSAFVEKDVALSFAAMSTITLSPETGANISLFAAYDRLLSEKEISAMRFVREDFRSNAMIAAAGDDFRLEISKVFNNVIRIDKTYSEVASQVNFDGTDFTPARDVDGLSKAGTYQFTIPVVEHYGGVLADWELGGGVVEYSLDGTNYTPLTRGRVFGRGTEMSLPIIRVSFAAGDDSDLTIRNLTFTEIASTASATPVTELMPFTTSARPAYFTGELQLPADSSPNVYPGSMPTFGAAGTLTIGENTDDPTEDIYAVEIWYTPSAADLSGTKYILLSGENIRVATAKLNFSGFSTVYVNKSTVTSNSLTLVQGQPYHIVAVYTAPDNVDTVFGHATTPVTGTVSRIGVLYEAPSQSDVDLLYDSQQGTDKTTLSDTSTLTMSESSVTTYELDWTAGAQ